MGVYRRTDAATYWMSLVIDGKRLRQDTGVQDRRVAGEIFAAWQVQMARARWLGLPAPTPRHTVQELVTEYLAKVTPRKAPASQRRVTWSWRDSENGGGPWTWTNCAPKPWKTISRSACTT